MTTAQTLSSILNEEGSDNNQRVDLNTVQIQKSSFETRIMDGKKFQRA
jgi:hypothetical protein